MLLSFCVSTFGSAPLGFADPRPFIPPLASCNNYGVCPSRTAACIGLPYIPACDPAAMGAAAGPAWNLTLQEAINTALGNSEAVRNLGLVEASSRNDIVRSVITSYDPLEADALAASEWGIFDPLLTTQLLWDKQDIPPGTSFSGIGNRPPQLDTADAFTSLEQLLPIGTRVRADVVTNYLFNPAKPPGLSPNPQYFSYHQVGVTQPLLRGLGVDVTMAPIKIAAAEAERTDWQFKQEMLALVRSIETTYWGLYAQQQNLKVMEQIVPQFREVVRLRQEQVANAVGTESEVARAESEMYLFEQRLLETRSRVAEQALVLRNLMGLPPENCQDIIPLAVPVTTRPFESLQSAVDTAINSRPDVLRQRLAVYVATQERLLADNALKPQLDLSGFYRVNGLGETLPESYDSKADNNFDSWNMGVFFQIPLGRRQGRGELRAAEYRISRERAQLQQTAHQASFEVADAYRRIDWVYQQLQVAANRQRALGQFGQYAKAQFDSPPPGVTTVFALEIYLQNLREVTDASIGTNALLADYNSALARLEEVKGTLLENRMVEVAGDSSNSLPSRLPAPEIQMPESVMPTPPAERAAPVNPAPAQAPAPQGAIVAPPAAEPVEIAREGASMPQPIPLPAIEQPESITPTPLNAYADLPISPAPAPLAEPSAEATVEWPPSVTPEPAYTAMLPAPAAEPMPATPIVRQPPIEEPMAERHSVEYPATQYHAIQQPLAQRPIIETPVTEPLKIDEPAAQAPPMEVPPTAVLQLPNSIRASTPEVLRQPLSTATQNGSRQSARPLQAAPRSATQAPRRDAKPQLQMPNSVRPAAAEGRSDRVTGASGNQSARAAAVPERTDVAMTTQMQFPNSVGIAAR